MCRYETAKKKGDYDEEQQKRENAKQALERYMHYYQRWAENDKARVQVPSCAPIILCRSVSQTLKQTFLPCSAHGKITGYSLRVRRIFLFET